MINDSTTTTYFIETRDLESDDDSAWTTEGVGDANEFDSLELALSTVEDLKRMIRPDPSWDAQYRVVGSDGSTKDVTNRGATSTLFLTLDDQSLGDEAQHEVETAEEAAELALRYECDGTLRNEQGSSTWYVKADGTWRVA